MTRSDETAGIAERVARESYGRLVAFLSARTRDVAGAEDALAEAFASALDTWPRTGTPANPAAWLLTVARRRQTDMARRAQTRMAGEAHLHLMADEIEAAASAPDPIPDRRLALMFACAHPDIERGMRAPLILQTVLGLTADAIAGAFLIPPATMGQRLVRAKARLKQAGIPFAIPDRTDLPERLDAVLEAIYAIYAKGWDTLDGTGQDLAEEAIWLGQVITALLPAEPEAKGMLALMLHAEARRGARRSAEGNYVPLAEQDTSLWDSVLIGLAESLLSQASREGPSGRYQIEAAIQSVHANRRVTGKTDWHALIALYDILFAITGSPVVVLNRAMAQAEIHGFDSALAAIAPLADDPRMQTYQPYWAARGHLLQGAGLLNEAAEALTLAIGFSSDPAVRDWLMRKRSGLPNNGSVVSS